MIIKKIKVRKLEKPKLFYDITVEKYHNFIIGNSKIVCHNSAMSQAISKLARPFTCSEQILLGDGFFGSPVNPAPSAPRYTQVKISNKYKEIIERYKDLNILNEEGGYDWIHVDYPIGLSTHIVGIAVGYKSNILPRKPEDIIEYLEGNKSKRLKPYFKGFKGKITKMDSLKSAWLIEGETEVDLLSRTFKINSISPLQRYESFFTHLNLMLERSQLNFKIDNYSTEEVRMSIKFRCTDLEFKQITDSLLKETKQIITENLVFVKDGNVLEYENFEDYLEDFIIHRERVFLKRFERDLLYLQSDLEFLNAKVLFLVFMSEKKRNAKEVSDFLSQFKRWIAKKLETISLVKLTKEEINSTKNEIKLREDAIKKKEIVIKEQKNKLKQVEKQYLSVSRKSLKTTSLFGDDVKEQYHKGIKIWDPEEELIFEENLELEQNQLINEDE